ncbi:MAG TPA: 4-alpha-glucanotransferase [Candidatus Cybelea sp.]|nr:4-alpha-glucanotransferase [Candidatus Cybelea sp.]
MIEPHYHDYWGNRVETPESTRRALLATMGYDELAKADDAERLPPVIVVRFGETPSLPHPVERWSVDLEDGSRFARDLHALPLGYHRLTLRGSSETSCALIVVPAQCYLPASMRNGRLWAISTQLYALRSRRNWGIGDFTDLAAFAQIAGESGARALAINPLHELHPSNPDAASPYSPSSRLFLNVLYIDVEDVAELIESPEVRAAIADENFSRRLDQLRAGKLVDYSSVANAKLEILERLYHVFRSNHLERAGDARARSFRRFVRERGTALERLAVYEALAEHFRARDPSAYGWHDWPSEYRSPHSPSVARFAAESRERVEFYCYLQWLAHRQLAQAARSARRHHVALYCDLAVGVERNSADAWSDREAILSDASLGAPPDPLNLQGQNWGLAPLSPIALRGQAFAPFIALLRANMRYAGILRVDHVMALRRAFWIPRGAPASEGAYVRYDFEAMLGILALESVRHRCVVVGEDLGTVPDGFRERMQQARVLSSRVLYFERDALGEFVLPNAYPHLAAASAGTHDLPTLAGWWTGDRGEHEHRDADRLRLVDVLERAGAIDGASAVRLREDASAGGTLGAVPELVAAVCRFLAATPSVLAVAAIEDLLHETGAVNVPGTFDEHPNWRRKRSLSLESIGADGPLWQTGRLLVNR